MRSHAPLRLGPQAPRRCGGCLPLSVGRGTAGRRREASRVPPALRGQRGKCVVPCDGEVLPGVDAGAMLSVLLPLLQKRAYSGANTSNAVSHVITRLRGDDALLAKHVRPLRELVRVASRLVGRGASGARSLGPTHRQPALCSLSVLGCAPPGARLLRALLAVDPRGDEILSRVTSREHGPIVAMTPRAAAAIRAASRCSMPS